MQTARRILALLCWLLALPAWGQPDLNRPSGAFPGEAKRVRDDLDAADRLVAEGRFADGIRRYEQLITDTGDSLVSVTDDWLLPIRWVSHQRISKLPPEALRLYRDRADSAARKWLEQGAANRDVRLLSRIVAEAFCSKPGEQALNLLGDLALERGEIEAAERYWRWIARPASADPKPSERFELIYPQPQDPALARAKIILALLFRRQTDAAKVELKAFRDRHADAVGYLAGRKGKLADILDEMLKPSGFVLGRGSDGPATWATFGGDASRNRLPSTEAAPYWPETPLWRVDLPGDPAAISKTADPIPGSFAAARGLAFHPVIDQRHVFVADPARVMAYDLVTGRAVARYDHREKNRVPESLELRLPSRTDARYTLTVAGDRLYARIGAVPLRPRDPQKPQDSDNGIICLGLSRDEDGRLSMTYRWQLRSNLLDTEPPAFFEGTPVIRDGRLYVARSRLEGGQIISAVECYDADAPDGRPEPPPLRWRQDVWTTPIPSGDARNRHELLTLAGPFVIFATHAGSIVALDTVTGRTAWAVRYKSIQERRPEGIPPSDLSPCIHAYGRIFAAPSDSDQLLCLDAMTGETLWVTNPVYLTHLLGASRGKVFINLGAFPQGIRAYDVFTGKVAWTRPDAGDRATFGRGVLTDQWIFWPTRHGLCVLNQDDGDALLVNAGSGPLGNLAFGEGCLVVATPTQLWGYIPERLRLPERDAAVGLQPDNARAQYQRAIALADAGQWTEAERILKTLETDPHLGPVALHRRHEWLMNRATDAFRDGRFGEAHAILRSAAASPFSAADRLRAIAYDARHGSDLIPSIFSDDQLREAWLLDDRGWPQRAPDWAFARLTANDKSRLEKEAENLLVGGRLEMAHQAWERYPQTSAVRAWADEQMKRAEASDSRTEFIRACRQALRCYAGNDNLEGHAQAGAAMIRAYERAGFLNAADAAQHQRKREPKSPANKPAPRPEIEASAPGIALPVRRLWHQPVGSTGERLLTSFGDTAHDGVWYFSDDHQILCRSLEDGAVRWKLRLPFAAAECCRYADLLLAAGPGGVAAVDALNGRLWWVFVPPTPQPRVPQRPMSIFLRAAESPSPAPLSRFQLAGSRLVFGQGNDRLLAISVETGQVIWQSSPPGAPHRHARDGGAFAPHFLATPDVVVTQTSDGRLHGVDALRGANRFNVAAPAIWKSTPGRVGDHQAIFALDAERVGLFDLATGRVSWQHQLGAWTSLSGETPQLLQVGPDLWVGIARNYGYELRRIDAATGALQGQPFLIGNDRLDLTTAAADTEAVFVSIGTLLRAFSRNTGRILWEIPLPASVPWTVRRLQSALIIVPKESISHHDSARLGFGIEPGKIYDAWASRTFPMLVVDPAKGRLIQCLNFPAHGAFAAWQMVDQTMIVSTAAGIWACRGN